MEVAHLIADWHSGATRVVEPNVKQIPTKLASEATLVSSEQALQQADVLVMLVDHRAFRAVPSEQVAQRWVVDTKGVWR